MVRVSNLQSSNLAQWLRQTWFQISHQATITRQLYFRLEYYSWHQNCQEIIIVANSWLLVSTAILHCRNMLCTLIYHCMKWLTGIYVKEEKLDHQANIGWTCNMMRTEESFWHRDTALGLTILILRYFIPRIRVARRAIAIFSTSDSDKIWADHNEKQVTSGRGKNHTITILARHDPSRYSSPRASSGETGTFVNVDLLSFRNKTSHQ